MPGRLLFETGKCSYDMGSCMDLDFVDNPWKLSAVLQIADVEDLDILVDYLTDKGVGRVSMAEDVCRRLASCKRVGAYDENDRNIIGKEIRLFGGNSFANLLRGGDAIEYRELASDVAERLKARTALGGSAPSIEEAILRKVLANAFERMSDAQRLEALEELDAQSLSGLEAGALVGALSGPKFGKYLTYTIARVATDSMAKAVLGRGLKLVAGRTMRRLAAASVGGALLAGPSLVFRPSPVRPSESPSRVWSKLRTFDRRHCDACKSTSARHATQPTISKPFFALFAGQQCRRNNPSWLAMPRLLQPAQREKLSRHMTSNAKYASSTCRAAFAASSLSSIRRVVDSSP